MTGDRVLQAFAEAVRDGLRSTDVFGRYGGEEFVQILPHTALAGAILDAERLRNAPADLAEIKAVNEELDEISAW